MTQRLLRHVCGAQFWVWFFVQLSHLRTYRDWRSSPDSLFEAFERILSLEEVEWDEIFEIASVQTFLNRNLRLFFFILLQGPYDDPVISVVCWHVHCERCWLQTLVFISALILSLSKSVFLRWQKRCQIWITELKNAKVSNLYNSLWKDLLQNIHKDIKKCKGVLLIRLKWREVFWNMKTLNLIRKVQ